MALNILSIPAMSADPERLFLGAKITISDCQNQLGIIMIQALECLKSQLILVEILEEAVKDKDDGNNTGEDNRDRNQGGEY